MINKGPFYVTDMVAAFMYQTAYAGSSNMPRLEYAGATTMTFEVAVVGVGVTGNGVKSAPTSRQNV